MFRFRLMPAVSLLGAASLSVHTARNSLRLIVVNFSTVTCNLYPQRSRGARSPQRPLDVVAWHRTGCCYPLTRALGPDASMPKWRLFCECHHRFACNTWHASHGALHQRWFMQPVQSSSFSRRGLDAIDHSLDTVDRGGPSPIGPHTPS
jgi:hypothetical protein